MLLQSLCILPSELVVRKGLVTPRMTSTLSVALACPQGPDIVPTAEDTVDTGLSAFHLGLIWKPVPSRLDFLGPEGEIPERSVFLPSWDTNEHRNLSENWTEWLTVACPSFWRHVLQLVYLPFPLFPERSLLKAGSCRRNGNAALCLPFFSGGSPQLFIPSAKYSLPNFSSRFAKKYRKQHSTTSRIVNNTEFLVFSKSGKT